MATEVAIDAVAEYARGVIDGEIIAGKWVRLACERHLRDLERQDTDEFPYVFDVERAERVFDFFTYCRHVEGMLARTPIYLEPFQKFILGSVFGWVHRETGLRRYRKAYVQVARKNGKSTVLSGLGLYMLMADGELGSQVYATATKKEQAKIVYDAARIMASRSPDLLKRLEPGRDVIKHPATDSKFVPLSKDTKSLDGFNPYLGIIDEYHAHPTAEMYELLESGMGQRLQPLLFIITTAGFELTNPCYDEYRYCCQILEGTLENERYFVYIAQMDEDDSPQDELAWIKANPLLATMEHGMEYLRAQLKEALDDPRKMRNFLTKNLNMWVDAPEEGYLPIEKWRACEGELPDLRGVPCYIGVDLAAKIDLASVSIEWPLEDGRSAVVSHSFIPEDTLQQRIKRDKQDFARWVREGWITAIPGAVVDQDFILDWIERQVEENGWTVAEICVDPWSASQFMVDLQRRGYIVVEVIQGIKTLSEPTKDLREKVLAGKIIHDGNPVLAWAVANAVTREDHNGNIMLDKRKSRDKIDPLAALVTAHVRAMHNESTKVDISEFTDPDFLDRLWR